MCVRDAELLHTPAATNFAQLLKLPAREGEGSKAKLTLLRPRVLGLFVSWVWADGRTDYISPPIMCVAASLSSTASSLLNRMVVAVTEMPAEHETRNKTQVTRFGAMLCSTWPFSCCAVSP